MRKCVSIIVFQLEIRLMMMEDATTKEYPEVYTKANNCDDRIPFISTEYFEATVECLKKKEKEKRSWDTWNVKITNN